MSGRPELRAEAAFARHLMRQRRNREDILGNDQFAEPGWDMLLELFASTIEGRSVAVSTLVVCAAVPDTTAHRRLLSLKEAGMVERIPDRTDGRRTFVRLVDPTFDKLVAVIQTWMTDARRHLRE